MIRNARKEEIEKIVNLHLASLKEGILYHLGKDILKIFYKEILDDKNSFILVYGPKKNILGVAASTKNVKELFDKIKKNHFPIIAFNVLKKSLANPSLPFKLLQKYPSQINAELLFLYVKEAQRGKGIGEKLIVGTLKKFKAMGVNKYKITIISSNTKGKKFYERLGFGKIQTYSSLGEKRDIYAYKIKR